MEEAARDTTAILSDGLRLSTKLAALSWKVRKDSKFKVTSVMSILTNVGYLRTSFLRLKRNKATGIDGVTVKEYEENLISNLEGLARRIKEWRYKPQPVKRVYVPKDEKSKRPIGISAVEDKVVQEGIARILEMIYEVDFLDVSYGFRPKRGCHDALKRLHAELTNRRINCVVDMDITKYFDTIDHEWLMKFLRVRISDRNLLRIIGRFLNTGIMEEGQYIEVDKGTAQGSIMSPILANVYLHYILDLWFEKKEKKELKWYAQLIRYADDFVVLFQSIREGRAFMEKIKERFNKFGLSISEAKSKIIMFGRYIWEMRRRKGESVETFDFLGFRHFCDVTKAGGYKAGHMTSPKKFKQKMKAINQWIKAIRNKVELEEWWKRFGIKLRGHYCYYGISGNSDTMRKFYRETMKLAYKWINRRSQRKSYTSSRFSKFLEHNPLPMPKIYHSLYT